MELLKILLAEDNLLDQMLVRKVAEDAGFVLEIVIDGQQAIEKLQEQHYDLVLMDLEMPVMNGYEATKYIRQHLGAKCNIPIIIITSQEGTTEAANCLLLGANSFITKPFHRRSLLDEINTLMI